MTWIVLVVIESSAIATISGDLVPPNFPNHVWRQVFFICRTQNDHTLNISLRQTFVFENLVIKINIVSKTLNFSANLDIPLRLFWHHCKTLN